ncbi:MAG: HAMP domain-containing histidine kinase [Oscillospiraceae bacterium]|jgi:signal transduction histidine kinase|nr:HAMP domain-containing histidine kinase [Oscillospiraceae bacterium]
MITKELEASLNLIGFDLYNAAVLIDSHLQILWLNRRYQNIFKQKKGVTIPVWGNLIKENVALGGVHTVECYVPATAINFKIKIFPISDQEKTFHMLEFVIPDDVISILDNNIGDILRAFSFQFRAPVSKIVNITDAIEEQLNSVSKVNKKSICEQVHEINHSCMQILRNFANFLDIAKYSAGLHELELRIVEVNEFIKSIVSACSELVQSKGAEISFVAPSPEERFFAAIDAEKITLALVNVILNSCIYTREGNQVIVTVAVDSDQENFCISVQDFGMGMDQETLRKATTVYYAGSFNRPYSQGLGLALVKYIVDLHSGELWLNSEKNLGTIVKITLPFNLSERDQLVLHSPTINQAADRYSIIKVQFS